MIESAVLGRAGEKAAEKQYKADGYKILDRNFRTRQGEIDLIVCRGELLVFAEVKTRSSTQFSAPREAVGISKQRRIVAAAKAYLQQLGSEEFCIRFDVVEVVSKGNALECHRIEQAFEVF